MQYLDMESERLMTQKTLALLHQQRTDLQDQLIALSSGSGSGHARSGYHDAAGIEHDKNLLQSRLDQIGDLGGVKIIEPREEVDRIDVGNRVTVNYGEEDIETIYLLGPDDASYLKDLGTIASYESPLGKAIRGKKTGETAELRLSGGRSIDVRIVSIQAGEF
jgi:transcription elongation GreA/GreB family factor